MLFYWPVNESPQSSQTIRYSATARKQDPVYYAFLRRVDYKQPNKIERIFYEKDVNVFWYVNHSEIPDIVRTITQDAAFPWRGFNSES